MLMLLVSSYMWRVGYVPLWSHAKDVCIGDRECSVCGKNKFRSRQDFTRNVQKQEPSFKLENILDINNICKCKCGLGFTRPKSLTNHVKHACANRLICEHCGKASTGFKNKMEFRMHMNGHSLWYSEPDLQDLLCKVGFRSFKTQADKDRHIYYLSIKELRIGKLVIMTTFHVITAVK